MVIINCIALGGVNMNNTMIVDTMWVFLTAILVFFMNLGFAAVEAGFARSKNTVNILSKNFIVFAVSSLGFLIIGLIIHICIHLQTML